MGGRIAVRSVGGGERTLDDELRDQGHHTEWMREGKETFQTGFSSVSCFPSTVCSGGCLLLQVVVSPADLQG